MSEMIQAQIMDVLMAEYVSGVLTKPANVLVDCYLELLPERQTFVRELEALAGHSLDMGDEAPIKDASMMLETIFATTDKSASDKIPENILRKPQPDGWMPAKLKDFIGYGPQDVNWRMKIPGVYGHKITAEEYDVSLLKIKPGVSVPSHTHEGRELTLVLKGSFDDGPNHYKRGDISVADGNIDHKPVAGMKEECICFVVNDAPLRLTGPIGRIFSSVLPG